MARVLSSALPDKTHRQQEVGTGQQRKPVRSPATNPKVAQPKEHMAFSYSANLDSFRSTLDTKSRPAELHVRTVSCTIERIASHEDSVSHFLKTISRIVKLEHCLIV